MKNGVYYYIVAVVFIAMLGCNERNHNVVVIEKTKSYHINKCPRTSMANIQTMTITEAQALKYRPCADCRPDTKQ